MRIKLNISCVVVLIAGMVSAPALSIGLAEVSGADRSVPEASQQKWTPVQKEVWRTVQAYSDASHHRDLQKYLSFWHPDFLGWHNGDDHPTDHEQRSQGLKYYFGATKSLEYELEPMGIQVIGERAAIVHYKLRNVIENVESGKVRLGLSYWTDYLTFENGKWLLISDHGGSVPAAAD